jgi:hypothetical protein
MKWVPFIVGLLIGGIGGAGGVLYLVASNKTAAETDVVFAQKNFYDGEEMIGLSGTMTGAGIAYPNNSYSIGCYRDRKECWLTSVEQIGRNLMGRMDAPYAYEISKWTPNEVIAGADGSLGCFKTTITIGRKTQDVLWVEEPVNQTQPRCKNADTKIRKYSFDDSPGWKKIFGKP